jgi:hypothetical protein
MRITTKLVLSWEGEVLEQDSYEWGGLVDLFCGTPPGQKALAASQTDFYTSMTNQSKVEFAQATTISDQLEKEFSPIFAAGPSQYGFDKTEDTALRTESTDTMAAAAHNAVQASRTQQAGEGGGNEFVPQGANRAITAGINVSAADEAAKEQLAVTEKGYETGNANWKAAAAGLETSMAPYSAPTSTANSANTSGEAANQTDEAIAQESSSWMNLVSAGLGAAATLGSAGIKKGGGGPVAA